MRQVISYLGPPTKECRDLLKPLEMPEIYDVDINALKYKPSQPSIITTKELTSRKLLVNGDSQFSKNKQIKNKKYTFKLTFIIFIFFVIKNKVKYFKLNF